MLLTFPNVLITAHEALAQIAKTTLENVSAFEAGSELQNEVRAEDVLASENPKAA